MCAVDVPLYRTVTVPVFDDMDSETTSSAFTFGVGYPVRGVDFDFGGMVRTRDYRAGDDRIAESLVAGLVTFSYAF